VVDYHLERERAEDDRHSPRKLGSWLANLLSLLEKDNGTVATGCTGHAEATKKL